MALWRRYRIALFLLVYSVVKLWDVGGALAVAESDGITGIGANESEGVHYATVGNGGIPSITLLPPIYTDTGVESGCVSGQPLSGGDLGQNASSCLRLDPYAVLIYVEAAVYAMTEKHQFSARYGNASVPVSLNIGDASTQLRRTLVALLAAGMSSIQAGQKADDLGSSDSGRDDSSTPLARNMYSIGYSSGDDFRALVPTLQSFKQPYFSLAPINEDYSNSDTLVQAAPRQSRLLAATADFVEAAGWDAVLIFASLDSPHSAYDLSLELERRNVCVAYVEFFNHMEVDSLTSALLTAENFQTVRVAVLLASVPAARAFLTHMTLQKSLKTSTEQSAKLWIGVEPWTSSSVVFSQSFGAIASRAVLLSSREPQVLEPYFKLTHSKFAFHIGNLRASSSQKPWLVGALEMIQNESALCFPGPDIRANSTCPATNACPGLSQHTIQLITERATWTILAVDMAMAAVSSVLRRYANNTGARKGVQEEEFLEFARTSEKLRSLREATLPLGESRENQVSLQCLLAELQDARKERYKVYSLSADRSEIQWAEWEDGVLRSSSYVFRDPGEMWAWTKDSSFVLTNNTLPLPVPSSSCTPQCPFGYELGLPSTADLASCCSTCYACDARSYSDGRKCIACPVVPHYEVVNPEKNGCMRFIPLFDRLSDNFTTPISAVLLVFVIFIVASNLAIFCSHNKGAYVTQYMVLFGMVGCGSAFATFVLGVVSPQICLARVVLSKSSLILMASAVLGRTSVVMHIKKNDFIRISSMELFWLNAGVIVVGTFIGCALFIPIVLTTPSKVKLIGTQTACVFQRNASLAADLYLLLVAGLAAMLAIFLANFRKMKNYNARMVLVATLALFIFQLICSVTIYLASSYLTIATVIQMVLLQLPPYMAICFVPLVAILRNRAGKRKKKTQKPKKAGQHFEILATGRPQESLKRMGRHVSQRLRERRMSIDKSDKEDDDVEQLVSDDE